MKLNKEQERAVKATDGRVLILAGAGSGKTRVIIHRIAYLIQVKKVDPASILGLTFTNKAAAEMRARVQKMLGKEAAKAITLCTFHSFCLKLLRSDIEKLGYTTSFSLYDERDMRRMLGQIAEESGEEEAPPIDQIAAKISLARSQGTLPDQVDWKEANDKILYQRLENSMRAYNAVDFDSLLTLTVQLFRNHPEVLEACQERYRYLMIDEYQDTNPIQYEIASLLSAKHNNLCVVGDDDQSIYGWRGAEIKNILNFESATVIKLQQNYRSLPAILHAANHLIRNNSERHEKSLYSASQDSEPIALFHAPTEADEAATVVQRMVHFKEVYNLEWRDMAILYRSNILSRPFEIALLQGMWQREGSWVRGIPYEIFGGTELFARSEIKDIMAFLRLIANPKDEEALLRIINVPRRGISDRTLEIVTQETRPKQLPLWDYLKTLESHPDLTPRAIQSIKNFVAHIEKARESFETKTLKHALEEFLEEIHYKKAIEEEVQSEKARAFKWENVVACLTALENYEEELKEEATLQDFITTSLLDTRRFSSKEENNDRVSVMTFHSAKGLEFEACFLVGLEDKIMPHEKSLSENRLEEERRLMYVAITRARRFLTLSMSRTRKRYGKEEPSSPSRFILELPKEQLRLLNWRQPF
jgi:superfamily I DNA/RNA helicase